MAFFFSAELADKGGHVRFTRRKISRVLAACSGVGCIGACVNIDLIGKLAGHKAVLRSKQLIICGLE